MENERQTYTRYKINAWNLCSSIWHLNHLCGLVVRVLGYRSGGPGRFPALPEKKIVDLERGPLSLVSTTEELLDRKVAALV
jgi:hypothetical protein